MDDDVPVSGARERSVWLRPGGISAIAGVAAVVISAVGLLIAFRPDASAAPASSPSAEAELQQPAMFVYGSSMPGQSRHDEIEQYVVDVGKDSVDGLLYDSGLGYPMAKFDPGGEIPGYVLWLDPETADDVFREQTRLESGLFHPVTVRTKKGVTATAYEYIGSTDGFPRIERWDGSTADFGQYVRTSLLTAGDCYQLSSYLDEMITQWCEAPHAFEVYFADTAAEADDENLSSRRCAEEFVAFAGVEATDSELAVEVLRPDDEPSLLVCAVYLPGDWLIGTEADSGP